MHPAVTESGRLEYKLEDTYYAHDPQPREGNFRKGFNIGFGVVLGATLAGVVIYGAVMGAILLFGMVRYYLFM